MKQLRLLAIALSLILVPGFFIETDRQASITQDSAILSPDPLIAGNSNLNGGDEQGSSNSNPKDPSKSRSTPKEDPHKKDSPKN